MRFSIPNEVQTVLDLIRGAGFRALPVGGCVRDILRGEAPHDWDITTSATPDEMLGIFSGHRVRRIGQAGIKHGTVTVIIDHIPIEVTSFRCDGEYKDGRRPDEVFFSRNVEDDLARRDFTINALCIDENGGIIDMFGGQNDLQRGIIRAIGDPDRRFCEDALRILRALRFAAVFGYEIDAATSQSMLRHIDRLDMLARERVGDELIKLICAPYCLRVLLEYKDIVCAVIPELAPTVGVYQREDYHCYDVYDHIMHSVAAAPAEPIYRLTMLLHDIGKPECADGKGHFYRHPAAEKRISEGILKRLNCGRALRERILFLIERHDMPLAADDRAKMRKQLAKYGEQALRQLIEVKMADVRAQRPEIANRRVEQLEEIRAFMQSVLAERPALSLSQLKISGDDLIAAGMEPGPEMGRALKEALTAVLEGRLPNERSALIDFARGRAGF